MGVGTAVLSLLLCLGICLPSLPHFWEYPKNVVVANSPKL